MNNFFIPYFSGSTPADFEAAQVDHPFSPCPDTPNCAFHSVTYSMSDQELFAAAKSAIHQLSSVKVEFNSQSLRIEAVIRIRFFGFKDDVTIIVQAIKTQHSILHIKSVSRVGRSDLGVNRRRIKRILSTINHNINKPS